METKHKCQLAANTPLFLCALSLWRMRLYGELFTTVMKTAVIKNEKKRKECHWVVRFSDIKYFDKVLVRPLMVFFFPIDCWWKVAVNRKGKKKRRVLTHHFHTANPAWLKDNVKFQVEIKMRRLDRFTLNWQSDIRKSYNVFSAPGKVKFFLWVSELAFILDTYFPLQIHQCVLIYHLIYLSTLILSAKTWVYTNAAETSVILKWDEGLVGE